MKNKNLKLTEEQQIEICYLIGVWYLKWKDNLVDFNNRTHKLGFAKEELKNLVCSMGE